MIKVIITPGKVQDDSYAGRLAKALEIGGVQVRLCTPHRFLGLWQAIREHGRPDVVHLQRHHGFFRRTRFLWSIPSTFLFLSQVIALRLLGTKFVWTIHNVTNHEKQQERWELQGCRLLARLVDRLIVHCDAAVSIVAEAYRVSPKRISVVPHGNYIGAYPSILQKDEARRRLGLPLDVRIALFLGTVRDYKGLARLIDVFSSQDIPSTMLVLAGQPWSKSLAESLSRRLAPDPRIVARFEYIPADDLPVYFGACDFCVLPYKDILTSGAIVLSASFGRPVVAPRLGCIRDFPADAGFFYDPADEAGLGNALEKAFAAPLDQIGVNAKKCVAPYSWEYVARETIRVYSSVLGTTQT